jgi:hypothetical protein
MKKNKIILTSIIAFLFLAVVLFTKPAYSFCVTSFLKLKIKSNLKSDLKYDSFKLEKNKIILKNVKLFSNNKKTFDSNLVEIDLKFKLKSFSFDGDIFISSPAISIYKFKNSDLIKNQISKNKFLSYRLNIENGSINLVDQNNIKTIYFNYIQKNNFSSSLELNFDKNNVAILNRISEGSKGLYTIDFKDLDISHMKEILNFFNYKYDLTGNLKGIFSFEIFNKKLLSFFSNLQFTDVRLLDKDSYLSASFDNLHLELNYPDNDLNQKTVITNFFKNKFLENTKVRLNLENLNLNSKNLSTIAINDLNFSFNPNIGSKFKAIGFIENKTVGVKDLFEINSKGFITSNFSNWLDINLNFKSNSNLNLSFKQIAKDVFTIHTDIIDLKLQNFQIIKDIAKIIYPKLENISFTNGNLNASIDVRFDNLGINKCFLTNLQSEDVEFKYKNISANINSILGKAQFDFSLKDPLDKFFTDIKIKNSSLKFSDKKLKDINIKLLTQDGVFQSSIMSANFDNTFINLDLKGHIKEFNIISKLTGKIKQFDDEFISIISCKRNKNSYSYSGNFQTSDSQDLVFGFEMDKFLLNKKNFFSSILNGWLRAERINLQKAKDILNLDKNIYGICNIAAFFEKDNISFQIKGKDLKYKNNYVDISIDKIGDNNSFVFEGNNYILGSFKNKKISAAFPSFKGSVYIPSNDLFFDIKNAKMEVVDNKIIAKIDSAESNLVNMSANLFLDLSKKEINKLDIKTAYSSKIEDFQNFGKYFDFQKKLNLNGDISGNCNVAISFFDNQIDFSWDILSNVKNGEYRINDKSNINNLNFSGSYFSTSDNLQISNLKANLNLKDKNYQLLAPSIIKNKEEVSLDLRVHNEIVDILRVVSNLKFSDNKYKCQIDENLSHFYFEKLNLKDLSFTKDFKMDTFSISNKSDIKNFLLKLSFLLDFGFTNINFNLDKFLLSKGEVFYDIKKNENLTIDISSNDLEILNSKITNLNFIANRNENIFNIEKFNFDDIESKFYLTLNNNDIDISGFDLKKDGLNFNLKGKYISFENRLDLNIDNIKIDLKKINTYLKKYLNLDKNIDGLIKGFSSATIDFKDKFSYKADFDLTFNNLSFDKTRVYNRENISVSFSSDNLLKVQGLDLSFYNKDIDLSYLSCQISNLNYDFLNKSFNLQNSDLRVPKDLLKTISSKNKFLKILNNIKLDEDLEINFDFESKDDFSKFKLTSKNLEFLINNKKYNLKNLSFTNFLDKVFVKFDFLHNKNFYTIDNHLKFSDKLKACSFFIDNTSTNPLKVSWSLNEDNNFKIKEIKGSFCGIDASFREENNQILQTNLFGSMKLDFSLLNTLLSDNNHFIDKFKIKKGYELSGKLNLDLDKKPKFNFKGIFSGKNFDLLNYELKTLFCSINASDEKIDVSNFKISDSSGILTINNLTFLKNKNFWEYNIPKIQLRELRPSLLKTKNEKQSKITPFLVREMNIFDFKGNTLDKNSITAKGYLSFINSFKRGHYVFDFPTDVLSRIVGLDLQLLTPVKGIIDFDVKDSRFYLSEMKDSFSENERSKFFLSDKGQKPYIDFDGNLYINIAMKQFVLFKFTESFIISIRGDLQTPKCNLKKKRGFFN